MSHKEVFSPEFFQERMNLIPACTESKAQGETEEHTY